MIQVTDATDVDSERAGGRETTARSRWLRGRPRRGEALLLVGFSVQLGLTALALSWLLGADEGRGVPSDHWQQLATICALFLGLVTGAVAVFRWHADGWADESQTNAPSNGLSELLAERFEHWELSPAQRDVAGYVVNGYSIKEIASFRDTSEGTVKAQTNAIYRKAGVTGSTQLLALLLREIAGDGDARAVP